MKHVLLIEVMLMLGACGGSDAGAVLDAPAPDAAAITFATCTGTCRVTAVVVNIASQRTLDVGYFGVNQAGTLHVEAYAGAAGGCPTMTSPTPDYALILGAVPAPTDATATTSPANLLDYKGDLLGGPIGKAAATVALTPSSYAPGTHLALDLALGFNPGTATGHLFATHCASLDN